ncbi:disease resistance protein RGA5 isoform X1 [Aegilops tauschii subsp. strangulata]|nr:disease resistance protein RGA5 isoform X1 [Aegilops tauschii subsp. strangulata]
MEVVVSASAGVLEALLPKLAKMLTDEYKLHKGAKEGVQYIRDELESMEAALAKVSEVPPDLLDKQVKLWATKVRKMSYNIEDTIDSFMVSSSGSSTACCCVGGKSLLPRTYKARGDIAAEIERIKKEVEEVSKRRERYKVDSIVAPAPSASDPRLLALYEDEAKLVGIDQSREEIIKLLSMEGEGEGASEQKLKLISIVGPGGMGKTTLANAVYQKLEGKFECTAFVSVSLQPNMKNILSSILRQVTSKIKDDEVDNDKNKRVRRQESQKHYGNTETWSEKEIIDKIRHALEKRRYLILIDDIWDEKPWKLIKCVLAENKLGNKVIMTTRNVDVARSCCSSDKVDGIVHELQPLSDCDSEQLFYYKIFGNYGCPAELKVVSQKILEKCEGWPLGIIAIASLLANKPTQTKDQWCSVYNSISTGLENNHGVKDMRLILSLSYRDMPLQLRACLLYLSIFPEDQIIGRDDLIRRWIAEDLVRGRQDDNLYELGDKYFNELINRSMIQPTDVDAFGRAQACKVHDLVLEFITFLSAEEDFVTILNGQQPFPPQPDSIHRLSLRNSKGEHGIPQATKRLPHVRTLFVSSRANSMPPLSIFPVLRVLELEQCTRRNIRGVEILVHLRYLRLSQAYHYYYDVCIKLPEEIGNLQFLQTLDLKEARIKELPSTVVHLRQVRVLEISLRKWDKRCEERLLQCLCNLKQLEALYIFAPDYSLDFMLRVDWAPSHLRRFTVCARQNEENASLTAFVHWLAFSPFSTLPKWINSSLSHLSNLSIVVKILLQEDILSLGCLPALCSLYLQVIEAPTKERLEITERTGGHAIAFCCLVNFRFMSRAMGLVFRPGAMKGLQRLSLTFDVAETKDVYVDFNLGLENLTSLQALDVELDCRCATTSEVQAAEDATYLNARHPTFHVSRHFTEDMRCDQEEEIPELETMRVEDAGLARIGPCGEGGGRACDIKVVPQRLESVTIYSGSLVESLVFSYRDHDGKRHTAGPWGSHPGENNDVIHLEPSEILKEVSGTVGSYGALTNVITSLTLVTSARTYGPFGKGDGIPFSMEAASNSSIIGFFGRSGWYLDAIGVYTRPL